MGVLVQMSVKVSDVARLVATAKRFEPILEGKGARNQAAYEDENDPGMVSLMSEWDSHDAMNDATDDIGDRFNSEAGTEGLDWETRVWHQRSI